MRSKKCRQAGRLKKVLLRPPESPEAFYFNKYYKKQICMSLDWKDINTEQQDEIYDLIIKTTKENHCCRVGWACKNILGTTVQENVLDKMAARVVKNGYYIKETANVNFKYDWNILHNPYRKQTRRAILTTLLGVFVGFCLTAGLEITKAKWFPKTKVDTIVLKSFEHMSDSMQTK
jgi:hypothetical protein